MTEIVKEKKTFSVVTLGCRTNQYESQAYIDQLLEMGYVRAEVGDAADLCIVNTCTVTASADSSSRHEIRALARQYPEAKLVVTGCLAERAPDEMKAIPGVHLIVPNAQKEELLQIALPTEEIPEFKIRHFEAHTRAFVKIQDGCNSFCTYCIIPYVRGRSRSRPLDEIVSEVQGLIQGGFKEVVLTGINIGDYDGGPERPTRLADLVRAIDVLPGLERLRISSIDPDEVDEDLLSAVTQGQHTCPSMHIVLQSGSNAILKRMNRKYNREVFLSTIDRLREANPDFTFTTDVIVGFPGETERDFEETLDMISHVRFAKVHMFPYSPRQRTRAALYPNQISSEVIQERKQRLLRRAEEVAFALRAAYVGRTMSVLFESADPERPGCLSGHTENFLPVTVETTSIQPNTLLTVQLTSNTPSSLNGVISP
jgi:threonylcarbamoyladenosine tRNA methylthiotransferase MtaB